MFFIMELLLKTKLACNRLLMLLDESEVLYQKICINTKQR